MELEERNTGVGQQSLDEAIDTASIAVQSIQTYADLLAFFEQTEVLELSGQQARNRESALNQFLLHVGSEMMDPVGQELGDDQFLPTLAAFVDGGKAKGLSDGTLNNHKTAMRQWAETYKKMREVEQAPTFTRIGDALRYYIDKALLNGHINSVPQASLAVGWGRTSLNIILYHKGQSFTPRNLKFMADLEVLLKTPTTALTRFCEQYSGPAKKLGTTYGKKISELISKPYKLNGLTPALLKEVREFIKFKVAPSAMPLMRNESWRVKPKSEFGKSETEFFKVSLDGKTFSSTAIGFVAEMESFFGALQRLGYEPNKFSLAYLTDFTLIRAYVDFMHERAGAITETPMRVVTSAQSLMLKMTKHGKEKDFGYLLQHPDYADRLLEPIPRSEWKSWCASQVLLLKQYAGELKEGKHIKEGRDTEDSIRSILERKHPITALLEISENMSEFFEKNKWFMSKPDAIVFERDLLLFSMFPTQPMRISMFAKMKYRADNTGNLYQKTDGSWAVKFLTSDFKNEKGAASDRDYDIPLEEELWPKVEHYLNEVRPLFYDDRSNVFVSLNKGSEEQLAKIKDGRGDVMMLSYQVNKRSKQFLPGCPGFGPHSVRHIVATDYIKNNPNGFQVAADILHDRLDTVMKHYAHLKAADGHKFYQEWLAEVRNEWRKAV